MEIAGASPVCWNGSGRKGFHTTLIIQPIQEVDVSYLPEVRRLADEVILIHDTGPSRLEEFRWQSIELLARTPVLWRLNRFIEPAPRREVESTMYARGKPNVPSRGWFAGETPRWSSAPTSGSADAFHGTLKIIYTEEVFRRGARRAP